MFGSDFGRSILRYILALTVGLALAIGLMVLSRRCRSPWALGLLRLVSVALSGTTTWLLADLFFPTRRWLLDVIAGGHILAGLAVIARALRPHRKP
jgi:hypothetical protein